MEENGKISWFAPITILETGVVFEGARDFKIAGVAINSTVTRNNVKYNAEELSASAHSLIGKPLLLDHKNEILNIVGRTTNAYFDPAENNVKFEAKVVRQDIRDMIRDGLITNVSIGARVKSLVKEEKDGESYVTAKGIEFLELSFVPVPGDAGAEITHALEEAFALQEKESQKRETVLEEEKMQEQKKEVTVQESKVSLDVSESAEFAKIRDELSRMKEEQKKELREQLSALGVEETHSLDVDGLKALLTLAKSMKVKEAKAPAFKSVIDRSDQVEESAPYMIEENARTISVFRMPNSKGQYK